MKKNKKLFRYSVGNFICLKRIFLYKREYCINNKFLNIKCDYIYIKEDFFSCFENLKKKYRNNLIKERKPEKIFKKHKKIFCHTFIYFFSENMFKNKFFLY